MANDVIAALLGRRGGRPQVANSRRGFTTLSVATFVKKMTHRVPKPEGYRGRTAEGLDYVTTGFIAYFDEAAFQKYAKAPNEALRLELLNLDIEAGRAKHLKFEESANTAFLKSNISDPFEFILSVKDSAIIRERDHMATVGMIEPGTTAPETDNTAELIAKYCGTAKPGSDKE